MAQSMLKALFSTLPVFVAGLAQAQTTPATQSGPDAQPPSPPMGSDPSLPPSPGAPLEADRPTVETPPVSLAKREQQTAAAAPSWFARPPLTISLGEGHNAWRLTFYGFVEADAINDSTRSYVDSIGTSLVARDEYIEGQRGRTQFSIRNTRIGFSLSSPTIGSVTPSAIVEGDFFGNQPGSPPGFSEAAYFNSPSFRLRHAYLKLESD